MPRNVPTRLPYVVERAGGVRLATGSTAGQAGTRRRASGAPSRTPPAGSSATVPSGAARTGSCSGRRMSRTTIAHSHSVASDVREHREAVAVVAQGAVRPCPAGSPRAAARCRRSARTSPACQIRKSRQRGRASTASGSSQSTYCGEYTLFVSRNAATTRNASCGSRGRRSAHQREHRDRRRRPARTAHRPSGSARRPAPRGPAGSSTNQTEPKPTPRSCDSR